MKGVKIVVLMVLVVMLGIGIAFALQQEASAAKGKALFNDPKLGATGKTCNTCHPDGKGLEKTGAKNNLEKTLNACITTPLKGKALDVKSVEMQSLVLYIKSLGLKNQ